MRAARVLLFAALQANACLGLLVGHEPAHKGKAVKQVFRGGKHWVHKSIGTAVKELQDLEASTVERQKDVRQTILYVDKLKDSIGKKDSIFNGTMDQADVKMAQRMLALFSNKAFVKASDKAIQDLRQLIKTVQKLTAKRVKTEVLSMSRTTAEARSLAASAFFRKQTSFLGAQYGKAAGIVKMVLQALPEDFDGYSRLGAALLEDFTANAKNLTAHFTSSEETFCSQLMPEIEERTVPIIRHAKGLLPRIESYAKNNTPEAAPDLEKSLKKLSALSDAVVALFQTDARRVVEEVCRGASSEGAGTTMPPVGAPTG